MNRVVSFLAAVGLFTLSAKAQILPAYSMEYGDTLRTYSMFIPEGIGKNAPLIVYTHGYSTKPANRVRRDLNEAAAEYGFVVCYPDGAPDSRGKDGWNVGYPSQHTMTVDENDFFAKLLDEVCGRFGVSRSNVFLAGMSNGGDLCYQMAYTRPDLFKAYASVAGLTFEHVYHNEHLTIPVPFLEIHGTTDKTSMWQGDHANAGGWGPYIPVPLAVAAVAANNRCTTMTTDTIPSRSERLVTRYTYSGAPSGADAVLYRIEGGAHRWGTADVNTSDIICRFFSRYLDR